MPNISRRRVNQAMKFGQLEYNVRNIFSKNHAESMTGGLVPDKVKSSGQISP